LAPAAPAPQSCNLPTLKLIPHNSHRVTRSQTGTLKPKTFPDFHLYNATKHHLQTFIANILPRELTTYLQAAAHLEWLATMALEFQALMDNRTWTLCPRPLNHTIIKNK